MIRRSLGGRLLAVVGTAALLASPAPAAPAAVGDRTVSLTGRLVVVPGETPEQSELFAVRTDDGDVVAVSGDLGEDPAPGALFRGRVRLPATISRTADATAWRIASAQHLTLAIESATLSSEPPAATMAATHHWYAAAPSNLGALDQTDAELLAQISADAAYWESEANGRIADVVPPTEIVRYTASATTTAAGCGLEGADFWATVDEAAAQFPGASFDGTDQLLVIMPTGCQTGASGRGEVGALSFGNGGRSITTSAAAYFQSSLAHELGHNYGFNHARMGPCVTTCASEYGDYYSVMGASISGFRAPTVMATPYRVMQGITDPGEVELLSGGDSPVTITRTLQPRSSSTGLRSLAITDSTTGHLLYVDYRSGTGQDSGSYYHVGSGATSFRSGVVVEEPNGSSAIDLLPDGTRKALVAGETRSVAGGTVTIEVTAVGGGTATVAVTLPGLPAWPTPGTVSLSSVPTVGAGTGAQLTGWSPAPTGVDYTWLLDDAPIPGATAASYTPTAAQAGHLLAVRITARVAGYSPQTVTSAAVGVAPGTLTITAPPTVVGTAQVGRAVTCAPPTWTPAGGTTVTSTQWAADGVSISTSGPQLTPGADLVGAALTCRVTVSRAGYTSVTATSAPAPAVLAGVLTSDRPTIRGTAQVGRALRARPGVWTPGTTFAYRWLASGTPIPGATGPRLTLTRALQGQRIRVRVLGTLAGYTPEARRSAATARVS